MNDLSLVLIPAISAILSITAICLAVFLPKLLKHENLGNKTATDLEIKAILKDVDRLQADVESIEVDNYKKIKKKLGELESDILANELKTNDLHVAWKTHVSKWAAKMNKIEKATEEIEGPGPAPEFDDSPPDYPGQQQAQQFENSNPKPFNL